MYLLILKVNFKYPHKLIKLSQIGGFINPKKKVINEYKNSITVKPIAMYIVLFDNLFLPFG